MYEYQGRLTSAPHDGDTFAMVLDLGLRVSYGLEVRLKGVDAPELGRVDQLGEQARTFTTNWFGLHPGPYTVRTHKDQADKYGGRWLASVVAPDGHDLAIDLLQASLAKPYDGHGARPTFP